MNYRHTIEQLMPPRDIGIPAVAALVGSALAVALVFLWIALGQHLAAPKVIGLELAPHQSARLHAAHRWPRAAADASHGARGRHFDHADLSARKKNLISTDERCLPPALAAALDQVRAACGPVAVNSTLREHARIPTGHVSLHANCHAVDFMPRDCGCAYRALKDWRYGLSLDCRAMHHIHLSEPGPRNEGRFYHHRRTETVSAKSGAAAREAGVLR